MSSVDLEGLTKQYGKVVAVDHMDLQVRDRELIVLVGPSGCGKTTTLRLIAGLEDATAGSVHIGDRDVGGVAPRDRNIAMVFQHGALYPHLDVFGNMAFGLRMRRVAKAEINRRVRQAAAALGMEALLSRKPSQLSGGQQQRVALGRAVVREPDAFLLDEPLSSLDANLRMSMRRELVRLHQRLEATMIYVTHDQDEAMMMGDRIVVVRDGRVQQAGPPLEVYELPANRFVASFLGSPAMNLLEGRLRLEEESLLIDFDGFSLETPPNRFPCCRPYAGKTVCFGIRPEDIGGTDARQRSGVWSPLSAMVAMAQPLGAETIVELRRGGESLLARMDAHCSLRRGQETTVYLNMARCHLFDPTDERAIREP